MTIYQPGQRIRLIHTSDPHTDLRPGDLGTVRHHNVDTHTVQIAWDSGSTLSMLLDHGDRITIAEPATTRPTAVERTEDRDAAVRAAVTAAGGADGRSAADWWCQHTIGGSASGDVRAAARRILAGIDDGDPAVGDTLPVCNRSDSTLDLDEVLDEHGTAPAQPLTDAQRSAAVDAYADAYDEAAEARVVELCHLAASATGTDLSHLHPDRVAVGAVGVFSGDWHYTLGEDGTDRYTIGYVGTLLRWWNGWAVFTCTREVAEAIVADQEQQRQRLRDELRGSGVADADVEQRVDAEAAQLFFDGDVLVVDLRILQDDPEAIERTISDSDGRYVVMGGIWRWEAVDPYACDRIIGDIPAPDGDREMHLRHTPRLRVPHDRLRLTGMQHRPTADGLMFTRDLTLHGVRVGTATHYATDNGVDQYALTLVRGHHDVLAYLSGCRFDGAPVSMQRLLHALADEYYLDVAITQATAGGGTPVRLVDDAGHTTALRLLIPAPRHYTELLRCARDLVAEARPVTAGKRWQVWTGTCWSTLPGTRP
jgi:hypothetical protein